MERMRSKCATGGRFSVADFIGLRTGSHSAMMLSFAATFARFVSMQGVQNRIHGKNTVKYTGTVLLYALAYSRTVPVYFFCRVSKGVNNPAPLTPLDAQCAPLQSINIFVSMHLSP